MLSTRSSPNPSSCARRRPYMLLRRLPASLSWWVFFSLALGVCGACALGWVGVAVQNRYNVVLRLMVRVDLALSLSLSVRIRALVTSPSAPGCIANLLRLVMDTSGTPNWATRRARRFVPSFWNEDDYQMRQRGPCGHRRSHTICTAAAGAGAAAEEGAAAVDSVASAAASVEEVANEVAGAGAACSASSFAASSSDEDATGSELGAAAASRPRAESMTPSTKVLTAFVATGQKRERYTFVESARHCMQHRSHRWGSCGVVLERTL